VQKTKTTRRGFLRASAGLIGGGWLAANWPGIAAAAEAAASARDAGAEFSHLDPLDAADLEAMAALAQTIAIDLGVSFALLFVPGIIGASLTAEEY